MPYQSPTNASGTPGEAAELLGVPAGTVEAAAAEVVGAAVDVIATPDELGKSCGALGTWVTATVPTPAVVEAQAASAGAGPTTRAALAARYFQR